MWKNTVDLIENTMLSLLLYLWFLWGICVLCLHIESPSFFTHRDRLSEGGEVAEDNPVMQGKEERKLLKQNIEQSDRVFYGNIRGRERVRRFVGDGRVGSAPMADEGHAQAPPTSSTIVHYEQLMILKTTDLAGRLVGCTFSQRLQSSKSQRSQFARWWRRSQGAVERPSSVSGFLDVVEGCLETEVPASRTSWTFRTLLKVIAPGERQEEG
nr:uncharacterized protein LOC113802607 [Penaeus vannamei]